MLYFRKRNIICSFVCVFVFIQAIIGTASAESASSTSLGGKACNILINGNELKSDVQPLIINNRVLAPFRVVLETLGVKVSWIAKENMVNGFKDDISIELRINERIAKVNGEQVNLDVPALIINNRTYVPVRFIAEALKAKIEWNEKTSTVMITTSEKEKTMSEYQSEQNYKFSEDEMAKLLELNKNIPEAIKIEFNSKSNEWIKTWSLPELAVQSDISAFSKSAEYKNLIDFCKKNDKVVWSLLFEKWEKQKFFSIAILDLTLEKHKSIFEQVKREAIDSSKSSAPSSEYIMYKYIQKLLAELN